MPSHEAGRGRRSSRRQGFSGGVSYGAPAGVEEAERMVAEAADVIGRLLDFGQSMTELSGQEMLKHQAAARDAQAKAHDLELKISGLREEYADGLSRARARIAELEDLITRNDREIERLRAVVWPGLKPR